MPTVTVILTDPVPPGAPLLLAPRFPDAFGFRLDSFDVEGGEILDTLKAENSGLEACVIRPTATPTRPVLRYRMAPFGEPPEWIWQLPENRTTAPSVELDVFVTTLVRGASTEAESLQRIVDHAAGHYWYGHGPGDLMEGRDAVPLLTQPIRGHCLYMHGYCVAACRAVGLTAACRGGFWFKAGRSHAPGMHCWFVVKVDGATVHDDVSHQLKLPTWPVLPGLNPLPGVRFPAGVGKRLVFPVGDRRIEVKHFAKFVWVTEDGRDHYPAHEPHLSAAVPGAGDNSRAEPFCSQTRRTLKNRHSARCSVRRRARLVWELAEELVRRTSLILISMGSG